ncbi:MAG TPA: hypothetical protein ENI24_04385, partial [Methylophaga sp.]|nr:hypothetical protein [Methylophaga sp.]
QAENTRWHKEHLTWIQEADEWQHETRRLLALLYLLERALPEHSSLLNNHAMLIAKNEHQLQSYQCDIGEHTDLISQAKQNEFHQRLSELHEQTKQEHLKLKQTYSKEMDSFKSLVLKLLKECQ